ncbi:MoaD/ThiS family protein [Algoriphagus aestuariicola]|jgi:molybdopterin converting factor small subunit|uniref:MoaD/ThiS family protein n=1 Tax=Algoriphagus aestuariicola TaxID=1852016 RepID=A0ABS3BRH1_9BACT|nr:MoaD/ThiS family protein [Algoriphagus aestuariicola]MBN7801439.1 MoaD/ThiS family protein [Algoriphagus aestuariicola]
MNEVILIKAFGMIAEKIGGSELEWKNPGTLEALRAKLENEFPDLKAAKFGFAINKKLLQSDAEIPAGAEVALLPPFSGG